MSTQEFWMATILVVLLQEIKLQGTEFMSLKRGLMRRSQTILLEDSRKGSGVRGSMSEGVGNGFENKSTAGK